MVVSSTLPAEVTPAWVGEGGVLTGTDVVWRGLSLATGGSLTLTCGVTVNAAPAGNRLVLAAYQTTATSWSTPVFGRPVTVAVFTRHLYLPVVLRAE